MNTAAAVGAALGAALCFGTASAVQHGETGEVEQYAAYDPGLLTALARRPRWWAGVVADVVAVVLQAVALAYGPVALVQPLLVAGLPAAVLLSCLLAHRRPRRAELAGVALCSAGLGALAPATATVGLPTDPTRSSAAVAGVALLAVTAGLLLLARLRPVTAGVATGAAAGVAAGTAGVLLAVCAGRVGAPRELALSLAPYATVAVGGLALLLAQAAFQTGAIAAPLATLSIVEPAVAVLLAVALLSERLPGSPAATALTVAGSALAVAGVVVLARRSALAGPPG